MTNLTAEIDTNFIPPVIIYFIPNFTLKGLFLLDRMTTKLLLESYLVKDNGKSSFYCCQLPQGW